MQHFGFDKVAESRTTALAAVADLKRELAAQRVIWVDGLHLPQSITAAPGSGLELAGTETANEPAR